MDGDKREKPIRLAIIGAGIYAREAHAPALLRLRDRFEVVAVCARTQASADALADQIGGAVARFTDVAALLAHAEIEAVDILLPIDTQPGIVAQALAAGKHVISEKPIAPDLATGRAAIAVYGAQPGQVWMVAENWRYEEAFERAAAMVHDGVIGRLLTVHFVHFVSMRAGNKYHASQWRRGGAFQGGFLLDGGVHFVAAMRMIAGEIVAVTAHAAQLAPDLPPTDTLAATLQFANGALGVYLNSFAADTPWNAPLTLVGMHGSLRVARGWIERVDAQGAVEKITCSAYNGVERELIAFADAVRNGLPHRNTPTEALRDVAVIEAMLGSAQSEQTVHIVL